MTTPDEHTTPTTADAAKAWDRVADNYDAVLTGHANDIAESFLDRLPVGDGTDLLDVAAGSGALTVAAARRGASVTAIDLSAAMVDHLREHLTDLGLTDIEARVMDGQNLDLPDDRFDVAASQLGVMSFPDLPRGLREMARVTRPGGTVALVSVGAPPPEIEYGAVTYEVVAEVDPTFPGVPADPPPLPFQVADPDVLHQRMTEAGLVDVSVENTPARLRFASGTALWVTVVYANPVTAALFEHLTTDQVDEIIRRLDAVVASRAGDDGVAILEMAMNIGIATVPD
ncbi:MAG: methyltransferase domain-containing protein [Actinomycetota bacterium]|nr:methyltransferase domain-containing protein [Actinomycetota bacterium]